MHGAQQTQNINLPALRDSVPAKVPMSNERAPQEQGFQRLLTIVANRRRSAMRAKSREMKADGTSASARSLFGRVSSD
jgi:hypothetical protein